jgi:hypothetical protein
MFGTINRRQTVRHKTRDTCAIYLQYINTSTRRRYAVWMLTTSSNNQLHNIPPDSYRLGTRSQQLARESCIMKARMTPEIKRTHINGPQLNRAHTRSSTGQKVTVIHLYAQFSITPLRRMGERRYNSTHRTVDVCDGS